jgi:hypothetical protein
MFNSKLRLLAAALLLLAVALVCFNSISSAQEPVPTPPVETPAAPPVLPTAEPIAKPKPCAKPSKYRAALRRDIRFTDAGGDYHALPLRGHHKLAMMRKCVKERGQYRALRQMRTAEQKRMKDWRFHRYIDEITPYGKYAIPSYIVFRESRGDACAGNASSTAGGYYQFLDTTWTAYGGTSYPRYRPAQCAPAWEQHEVAHRAWAGGSGSSHWALTR